MECRSFLLVPGPADVLPREAGQPYGYSGEVGDESAVPGSDTEKLSDFPDCRGFGPLGNRTDLPGVGTYTFPVNNVPEICELIYAKTTFVGVDT